MKTGPAILIRAMAVIAASIILVIGFRHAPVSADQNRAIVMDRITGEVCLYPLSPRTSNAFREAGFTVCED